MIVSHALIYLDALRQPPLGLDLSLVEELLDEVRRRHDQERVCLAQGELATATASAGDEAAVGHALAFGRIAVAHHEGGHGAVVVINDGCGVVLAVEGVVLGSGGEVHAHPHALGLLAPSRGHFRVCWLILLLGICVFLRTSEPWPFRSRVSDRRRPSLHY